jgi:hypothetical protein
MKLGYRKEYTVWLLAYIIANLIAAYVMYDTNLLIGDMVGARLFDKNALLVATAVVVFFYYFILKTGYGFMVKIRVPKLVRIRETDKNSYILGYIMFALQVLFLVFNLVEGVNVAGSGTVKSDSPIAFIWIFIPVDILFLCYYGFQRDHAMFKYNIGIYVLSNVLRGWSSIFLFIIFFEWCRAFRAKKINFKTLIIGGFAFVLVYPVLLHLKWVMRGATSTDFSTLIGLFFNVLASKDYFEFMGESIVQLVSRLQHTSIVVEIIQYHELLQLQFDKGGILPFWNDGLPQLAYRRLMGIQAPPSVGVALTDLLMPKYEFELGSWNINVGFTGWFFIVPYLVPLYLFYNFILCLLSVFFIKQLNCKENSFDVLWITWLIFLLPGWSASFVGFIYSIFIFIILNLLAQFLGRITFRSVNADSSR